MRLVVLLNPKVPVEHAVKGREYAEASFGAYCPSDDVHDHGSIARSLREMADALESLTENDPTIY